jgi:outer membrane receptor protein involved in Fe transport
VTLRLPHVFEEGEKGMAKRSLIGVALVTLLLASLPASAQTTSGRMLGQVVDPNGEPLPGVTVTVASTAIMGGTRTAVSGESGAFRFAALPPGDYEVTATLPGFQTQTIKDLAVSVASTATANFTLQPEFSEQVIVTAETPLVDPTASGPSVSYNSEFLKDLPTSRNFYDIMAVSPDVSLAAEDEDRLVAGGSNVQSNNWFIDGIETTAPETGTAWIYVNPDAIEEVQVMHIGAPAEYGNMLGAALNVVTKSGSNEFKGGLNAYFINDSLVDSNINFDSEFPEYHMDEFWDVSATLGGPFIKDRLWFFGSYEYYRQNQTFPGADPNESPTQYADRFSLKLSAQINQSNLIDAKGSYDDWGYPPPANPYVERSAQAGEKGIDKAWGINYQSIFTDRTFLEARYTGFQVEDDYLSETGSTEPAYIDYSPPGGGPELYWGGVYYPWTYDTSLDQLSASVSHFADDFIAGDHDFKFGVQASRGEAKTKVAPSSTGTYYYHYTYEYDYYGTIYPYEYYYKVDGLPYFYGQEQESVSLFADDSWKVTDRLTVNLGLRYDHHKGVIPSYPRFDANGDPTGETIPGVDPVLTWDHWSPRLGFAYAAGPEQKTVVRGSFGVYFDGNVGGNWNYPPPEHPGQIAYLGESWDGPFDEVAWEWSPGDLNVDPDLTAPRTLQYSVGFEHAFLDQYSIGVTALYKDTKDLVGWEIMGDGVYEEIQFTDPFTGNQYTLLDPIEYPSLRKGNRPGFTIDPGADSYWQEYWALIVTFNRRFSGRWSMSASYTYSESTGLIPAMLSQWQFNPLYSSKNGSDPNSFLNADGQRLQGDRPHMLRVQANVLLPWTMNLSTMINLQSGRPYSRQAYAPTTGRPQVIMDPLSDDTRHGFQYLWDLGLGKRIDLGSDVEMQLDLQLLNVLNETPTDWWETVVLAAGDSYVPNTWVKPRRLQLRAGITF